MWLLSLTSTLELLRPAHFYRGGQPWVPRMRRSGRGGEQKDPAPRPALYETALYGPDPPERIFQAQIIELARMQGWDYYHTWSSINSPAGFPDLVMVRGPRVVFVEVKRDSENPDANQRKWLWKLAAAGQEAYLWKPINWDQMVSCLLRRPVPAHRWAGLKVRV